MSMSHWKQDCHKCGSLGDDVYRYEFIMYPGGHITLHEGPQMLCESCKQEIIDRAVAEADKVRSMFLKRKYEEETE